MNFTMGRYIAELDAEGRDRLISAPDFNHGSSWWDGSCGCLVGTATYWPARTELERRAIGQATDSLSPTYHCPWDDTKPAARFPYAVSRFGKERVVRAIKARAARLNATDPSTIARLIEAPVEAHRRDA